MEPRAVVTWAHDVVMVATATFQTMANSLIIESVVELELDGAPVFEVALFRQIFYPFRYSEDELTDLGARPLHNTPIRRDDCCGQRLGPIPAIVPSDRGVVERSELQGLSTHPRCMEKG